jgi:predicted RNase H-like nuclease (RuvC/YqgF family)
VSSYQKSEASIQPELQLLLRKRVPQNLDFYAPESSPPLTRVKSVRTMQEFALQEQEEKAGQKLSRVVVVVVEVGGVVVAMLDVVVVTALRAEQMANPEFVKTELPIEP